MNPFGDRGYVQLPTTESAGAPLPASTRREEEEGWFIRESYPSLFVSSSYFQSLFPVPSTMWFPLQRTLSVP